MEKICVLMSTYNGEKYLDEQIQSIINQEGVNVQLLVRDDVLIGLQNVSTMLFPTKMIGGSLKNCLLPLIDLAVLISLKALYIFRELNL